MTLLRGCWAVLLLAHPTGGSGSGSSLSRDESTGAPPPPPLRLAAERLCPRGRANVLDYGADPTGANDSAPAFRAAEKACQSIYAPAGVYTLRTPTPGNRTAPPSWATTTTSVAAAGGRLAGSGGLCPSDGHNCVVNTTACTCQPGDGQPFDMAAGTKHPGERSSPY